MVESESPIERFGSGSDLALQPELLGANRGGELHCDVEQQACVTVAALGFNCCHVGDESDFVDDVDARDACRNIVMADEKVSNGDGGWWGCVEESITVGVRVLRVERESAYERLAPFGGHASRVLDLREARRFERLHLFGD